MRHITPIQLDRSQAAILARCLEHLGHRVLGPNDLAEVARAVETQPPPNIVLVLIAGHQSPSQLQVLRAVHAKWPNVHIVAACDSTESARLLSDTQTQLSFDVSESESCCVRRVSETAAMCCDAEELVGEDEVTRRIFAEADRLAQFDIPILVTGETGTGKEVLARRIHRHSQRGPGQFVAVNCAGVAEALLNTQLFGYKKGAFTGADANTKGLVDEASRGVLFLDEIGDMPIGLQTHLLRFVESGEFRAVGGTTARFADVRIIAATNRVLTDEIQRGTFRSDLYFRLAVATLHLPPLRERRATIPFLVEHLLHRLARRFALPRLSITGNALESLVKYEWPGNLRELRNVLERATIYAEHGAIDRLHLPAQMRDGVGLPASVSRSDSPGGVTDNGLGRSSSKSHLARSHGISRTTLWRRERQAMIAGDTAVDR